MLLSPNLIEAINISVGFFCCCLFALKGNYLTAGLNFEKLWDEEQFGASSHSETRYALESMVNPQYHTEI